MTLAVPDFEAFARSYAATLGMEELPLVVIPADAAEPLTSATVEAAIAQLLAGGPAPPC